MQSKSIKQQLSGKTVRTGELQGFPDCSSIAPFFSFLEKKKRGGGISKGIQLDLG